MNLFNRRQKQSLDQELNIMPVLDILSTLVVFLLLTAVWYQVGSYKTENAYGATAESKKIEPSLVATFIDNKGVQIEVRDGARFKKIFNLDDLDQSRDIMQEFLTQIKGKIPTLSQAIVIPAKSSEYNNVIFVMDQIYKQEIKNISLGYQRGG